MADLPPKESTDDMKKPKPPTDKAVAEALIAEGDPAKWRAPLGRTMVRLLAELYRRCEMGTEAGGLSTLEIIGALGKLGALDVEAGALLPDEPRAD